MKIHKGTTRFVIPVPALGIAIKIARVKPKKLWDNLKFDLVTSREHGKVIANLWLHERAFHVYSKATVAGFFSNLSEWYYTIRHGSTFIAPTIFSCGFFSVVRLVESANLKTFIEKKIWNQFRQVVSDEELHTDSHHWGSPSNFGLLRGRFVMCDYGSRKTQKILRKYAQQIDARDIAKLFDP